MRWSRALVLFYVAAVSCCIFFASHWRDDTMGVKRPPNWGRSYPLGTLTTNPSELVRVELEHRSEDFVVLLGAPEVRRTSVVVCTNTIDVSSGGVVDSFDIINSVRGTALHVAAQSLIVRAQQASESPDENVRYHAHAAFGRPYLHDWTEQKDIMGELETRTYALRPFSTAVKITVVGATGGGAANFQAKQLGFAGGTVVNNRPVTDYATPQPLDPFAIDIEITAVNPAVASQLIFQVTHYWVM